MEGKKATGEGGVLQHEEAAPKLPVYPWDRWDSLVPLRPLYLPIERTMRAEKSKWEVETLRPLLLRRDPGTLPLVRAPAHLLRAALTGPAPPPNPSRISFMGWVLLFCACPCLSAHLQPPPQPYRSLHLLSLEVPRLERLLPPHIAPTSSTAEKCPPR